MSDPATERAAEPCTGLTARWCPNHGDCTCPPDEACSPECPLHARTSDHGELLADPSPADEQQARTAVADTVEYVCPNAPRTVIADAVLDAVVRPLLAARDAATRRAEQAEAEIRRLHNSPEHAQPTADDRHDPNYGMSPIGLLLGSIILPAAFIAIVVYFIRAPL